MTRDQQILCQFYFFSFDSFELFYEFKNNLNKCEFMSEYIYILIILFLNIRKQFIYFSKYITFYFI